MTVKTSSNFYMCIVRSDASFGSSTLTPLLGAETRTANARKKPANTRLPLIFRCVIRGRAAQYVKTRYL